MRATLGKAGHGDEVGGAPRSYARPTHGWHHTMHRRESAAQSTHEAEYPAACLALLELGEVVRADSLRAVDAPLVFFRRQVQAFNVPVHGVARAQARQA